MCKLKFCFLNFVRQRGTVMRFESPSRHKHKRCAQGHWTIWSMRTLGLISILLLTVLLLDCGLMPPRRQYIKEAKRQIIPGELLNTRWTLESWDNKVPDCKLTMDFYEKGRFTFKWNDLDFAGDNLWYLVKDSRITFHTRPIEKIVWTILRNTNWSRTTSRWT